jgi:membrane peptidoglycan carboxypeptidase
MKKIISFIPVILLIVITVTCISTFTYMYGIYKKGIDLKNIEITSIPRIYDDKGEEINVIYNDKTYKYVTIKELPKYVYNSFVAIEDKRFYKHNGYDVNRLTGATLNYILNSKVVSYGASTITQQLVRNITLDSEDTPSRKLREIARAVYLEDNLSKEQILEQYINYIYYGQGSYGIESASLTFFSKSSKDLNVAESAVIAAMPNYPEGNNPYKSDEAKNRLLNRQKLVLKEMLDQKYIDEKQYKEALNFKIEFSSFKDTAINQYVRLVINEAKEILESKTGKKSQDIEDQILKGDIKIYTNLNKEYQNFVYNKLKNSFKDDIESAFILTTSDGKIKAAVTSRTDNQFDRIKKMTRQPGSTIKPIAVYGPAFDLGILTPDSIVNDSEVIIHQGKKSWTIHNWYEGYRGDMSVYQAIGNSVNTIAVDTIDKVTLKKSIEYLKKMGISSLTPQDEVYPLAIGGITNGISPYEMVRAYNIFNNNGVYKEISFIDKIVVDGKTIKIQRNNEQIISEEANDMIKDCLHYTVESGTAGLAKVGNKVTFAKTGTTSDVKDFWLCGFTNDVTSSLWVGYDTPKQMNFKSGTVSKLWSDLVKGYY